MRYLPKSPVEREQMLAGLGVRSLEDLFVSIPAGYRLNRPLRLPGPLSEMEIIEYFRARAAKERAAGRRCALPPRLPGEVGWRMISLKGKIEIVNSG